MTSPEDRRLAHYAACQAEASAAVPAEPRTVAVPGHEDEVMAAHKGTVLPQTFSVADEAMA